MSDKLKTRVLEALANVRFPGMSRDIVSFGFVRGVQVEGNEVIVDLEMTTQNREAAERRSNSTGINRRGAWRSRSDLSSSYHLRKPSARYKMLTPCSSSNVRAS